MFFALGARNGRPGGVCGLYHTLTPSKEPRMPRTPALLGLSALLAISGTALAQNQMRLIDEERDLYRATFEGGTLTEFVEMLQEGLDGRVMFIAPERGDEISMPKFDIANVDATHIVSLSAVIAGVPIVEVHSELPIEIGLGEGVPVFVFDTREVLPLIGPRVNPETITELRFRGGTVREYVEALKEAGAEGRVVITGDDRDVPMQPVTLRNVTLESAVELLDDIADSAAERLTRIGVSHNNGLYRVHVETNTRTSKPQRTSRVWSLRHITSQGLGDDTLLAAIEAGAETLDDTSQPTLRYHEPTALLIANGTADALGLIDAIIDGLADSAIAKTNSITGVERMQQYVLLLERHIERMRTRAELMMADAESKRSQAESLRQDAKLARESGDGASASVLMGEVVGLGTRADGLEAEAEQLRFDIDGEKTRLAQLRQLIKQVEEGYARTPSEAILSSEFGVSSRPSGQ